MTKTLLMITAALALEASAADARYEYNERSELTRVMWNDEVMFGYEYDQIGNLKWACVGCKTNVYEVNSLNQYTTITDSARGRSGDLQPAAHLVCDQVL